MEAKSCGQAWFQPLSCRTESAVSAENAIKCRETEVRGSPHPSGEGGEEEEEEETSTLTIRLV